MPTSGKMVRERQPPTFVGREAELRQLQAAFEAAAAGRGSLVMLVGEPGIGKSALCEQVSEHVSSSDGLALTGHCYPEGSAQLPYQPFVEALEQYARGQDPHALRMQLGPNANEIARIVPAIRQDQRELPLATSDDPSDDRRRLLSGACEFLGRVGDIQPLLLVLEDLHDAERGTLDLLVYLARNITRMRVLLLGTYRDVEVDRMHPLSAALADLRRTSRFDRFHLKGLSANEVQRLLGTASGQAVPRPLAELLHGRTDGNPLFAHELLRLLLAEGLLESRDGALRGVGEQSLAGRIPEGLRDAVGTRLSRLSANTNRVLSIASVIGREFELEVLQRVDGRADEPLDAALEEAANAAIIEERPAVGAKISYRFTHAFFRQTLYEEIIAPRRIRLHQQIARTLEDAHARRLEDHAAELAEHYAFSSDTSDLAKAVHYAHLAARRARDVFAYGEAARQLERALHVQELIDPDDAAQRCDLLMELGEALALAGDPERVVKDVVPETLALADRLGDRHRAFRACSLVIEASGASGASSALLSPEFLNWAERAAGYAEPGSIEEPRANLALADAWSMRGRLEEARALRIQALERARELGDLQTRFQCAAWLIMAFGSTAPRYWPQRLQLADECIAWPREGVSGRLLTHVLWYAARIALAGGDRARAVDLWRQVRDIAQRTRLGSAELLVLEEDVVLAILDGHLEEAWTLAERYVAHADEVGAPLRGREISIYMLHALADYLGRPEIWFARLQEYGAAGLNLVDHPLPIAYRAISLARLGRLDEARALAAPLLDAEHDQAGEDSRDTNWLAILLECALVLEHREAARALAQPFVRIAHLSTADWILTTVARQLAAAAALQGDRVAARAYCVQALEAATKIGFRPERALVQVQLAELLLEGGDPSGALQQLNIALPELRQMQMRPHLERALQLVQHARESAASAADDGLTRREREVARLLAAGRSNREIAAGLVIAEGTVEVHTKRILSKLGFHSRSQVAAWWLERQAAESA